MEGVVSRSDPAAAFWSGKRVLVTGDTGFKGGWLSLWLQHLGAEVHGLALPPQSSPNLFTAADVARAQASSTTADIRDYRQVAAVMGRVRPEVVFHLAAQALVRCSYHQPAETYSTNVMGVVHLLEAVRAVDSVKAVVNVTSDKCYENREWERGYREDDALGGRDPYSSSKACAEIVTAAYRRSFLADAGVGVATARAGNVIGGGDWAADRLLPDLLRGIDAGQPVTIRFPDATRPWQHVLEPISGYLRLAECLYGNGSDYAEAWNFGPSDDDARSVRWVIEQTAKRYPGLQWNNPVSSQPHEAQALKLDSTKARARLGWKPRWSLPRALEKTLDWHDAWRSGRAMRALSLAQIEEYSRQDG
jgi:CDP-glucose 4,6-dehydratase